MKDKKSRVLTWKKWIVRLSCTGCGIGFYLLFPFTQCLAEDARVLPKGVSRASFVYGETSGISRKFNPTGEREAITAPYNLELSSTQLRKLNPGLDQLVNVLNATGLHYNIGARGNGYRGITQDSNFPLIGDALSRGALAVDAEAHRIQYNLSYQYGITDRFSIGGLVPLIHGEVRVRNTINGPNTADDIYQGFVSKSEALKPLSAGLNSIRSLNEEVFQQMLVGRGYSRFEDSHYTGLGDLAFGGRFAYLKKTPPGGDWIQSFQTGITVPTGKTRPPSELTQPDYGQGAWDIGLAHLISYNPIPLLSLSQGLHYTSRLPGHRLLRVRTSPGDLLPDASTEEELSQKLGDKFWATVGAELHLSDALSFQAGYEWFWKYQDRYEGNHPDRDYHYLSEETAGHLQTLQLGASVDTVAWFSRKAFPVPTALNLTIYLPLRGKNTVIAGYGTAELALYF